LAWHRKKLPRQFRKSKILKSFEISKIPSFVLISRSGEVFTLNAKHPNDSLLEQHFKVLMDQ
jgi:hypothetical protein